MSKKNKKEEGINIYKLKEQYPIQLDTFIEKLDNNIKKDIENGCNTDR
jgi:hypothetical protein|tara:strand:- start:127 stop:270 length:144 start_codon:yes stop_codon:yes gene_type:complete